MKYWLFGWLFILSSFMGLAQAPEVKTSADIYLGLQKLNVLGSVLYVAAHPDDENTRLITYLSKDRLYRTGYLSLTRGDGGQNLIGDEQGIDLGLIRTQELLAARRIDGGEQFFTRAYDFGYSKTPVETFSKWDKEKILADVVWVIRKFQPDIIITRFPTTGEGGHGHHTASAILANEAFAAAADPKKFPEQLQYVKPWQSKRVFWNTFNFSGNATPAVDGQLSVEVGGYNPLLGKSYGEIAAYSRSQHKSQGFGVPATRGEAFENFRLTAGEAASKEIMDGVNASWSRISGGDAIGKAITAAVSTFDLLHPEKSVPALVAITQQIESLPESSWKSQKLKEVNELIIQCSGIYVEATTSTQFAVQTDTIRVQYQFINRSGVTATLEQVAMDGRDTALMQPLQKNRAVFFAQRIPVTLVKPVTQPYWLEHPMKEGYFDVHDQLLIGQPDVQPAFVATIRLQINGKTIYTDVPVRYKHTDPVKGELYQPLVVLPPLTINSSPQVLVFRKDALEKKQINVLIDAHKTVTGKVDIQIRGAGQQSSNTINDVANGSQEEYSFDLATKPGTKETDIINSSLFYRIGADTIRSDKSMRYINYDHIPDITYFYRDEAKLLNIPLATHGKRIGYIPGAGDKVVEALQQMGYDVTILNRAAIARNNLQQFDAIITGVRAYNTNDWLPTYHNKLMKYVSDGGNLIVQYNTNSNAGPLRNKIGPYDFTISRTRVTDERAKVTFTNPQHPVLNFPNKIAAHDFDGWIQERSIYHATSLAKEYETVLSMGDVDEQPDAGSLIIAKHGKGYFTYTGIAFFRELPAGVPGAYRLMANLIALNRKKAF